MTNHSPKIEVITSVQRRRRYTVDERSVNLSLAETTVHTQGWTDRSAKEYLVANFGAAGYVTL